MDSKFKIGDRVVAYTGKAAYSDGVSRNVGVVTEVSDQGYVRLSNDLVYWYHPKQCRKLKPKIKLLEFWIQQNTDNILPTLIMREIPPNPLGWIHVREVRENK